MISKNLLSKKKARANFPLLLPSPLLTYTYPCQEEVYAQLTLLHYLLLLLLAPASWLTLEHVLRGNTNWFSPLLKLIRIPMKTESSKIFF